MKFVIHGTELLICNRTINFLEQFFNAIYHTSIVKPGQEYSVYKRLSSILWIYHEILNENEHPLIQRSVLQSNNKWENLSRKMVNLKSNTKIIWIM